MNIVLKCHGCGKREELHPSFKLFEFMEANRQFLKIQAVVELPAKWCSLTRAQQTFCSHECALEKLSTLHSISRAS